MSFLFWLGNFKKRLIFGAVYAIVVSYTFEGTGEHIWLITFCNAIGYTISGPVMIPFIVLSGVIKKPTRIAVISCATVVKKLFCGKSRAAFVICRVLSPPPAGAIQKSRNRALAYE